MRAPASTPRRGDGAGQLAVGVLTGLLAAAGTAAAVAGAGSGWPRPAVPPPAVVALLAALTMAARLQVRFFHRDHVEALDLFDAVLASVIFTLPAPLAVALAAVAMAVSEALLRTRAQKLCFNVAQWAAATGAGALCFAALGDGSGISSRNVVALTAAMAVVAAVNHLAMVSVLALVTAGPLSRVLSGLAPVVGVGWMLNGSVNLAFGLLLVAALEAGAWVTPLFVVPLGMLHWAQRGYAESRADRARLAGLQRATHALVGPLDPRDAVADFLAEVRDCFAVEAVELVLLEPNGLRVQRLGPGPAGSRTWSCPADAATLAAALLERGTTARVGPNDADEVLRARLLAEGWRDCLAAQLRSGGGVRGVLCAYDRTGFEGFEQGELAVMEALAAELAGALEKSLLVEEVLHQALHDALTDLPNRTLFTQRVQRAIGACDPSRTRVAVMLIDLDRFREVNDTLGHHNGDLLLGDLSARLRSTLRPGDTVARLGGDEFAIVAPDVADGGEAGQLAARVLRGLDEPFVVQGLALHVDASIGIALYPEHGADAATLLQRADVAMYAAKAAQGGVELYAPETDRHSPRRLGLIADLRSATGNGELAVVYQPKADLRTGRVTGVEALLRWHHPRHGSVPPEEFIPLAEQTGAIRGLTLFVLEQSLAQCRSWRDAGLDLEMAVNLSVRSLAHAGLPEVIAGLLDRSGVPAERLTLELTESSVMTDTARTEGVLGRLDALGVRLSIDDFGTGYSSLSYLRRLPVDEIKIDRSFVMGMCDDDNDAVIVRSTVDLGHNLGLRVVAEGVEDERSWARLAELGCDQAQGYWLGRPLPARDLERLVSSAAVA